MLRVFLCLHRSGCLSRPRPGLACTRSPKELVFGREAYHVHYKKSLEEDVTYHITGDHRKFRHLLRGTEEDYVTRVIATRDEVDLKIIVDEYQKRDSSPLDYATSKDMRGDYGNDQSIATCHPSVATMPHRLNRWTKRSETESTFVWPALKARVKMDSEE
ncbi:hypothetical protein T459_19863 [Capsicum annuum]|uniref:Uncharacterized protein n=1 Tax=Capsicum annuum TaxID=4072 RepID=A0A2G2Z365_CAPAN|nr:hypothetical protein T459_19863 [Capsicum annuum]